jgi:hypothetical protein
MKIFKDKLVNFASVMIFLASLSSVNASADAVFTVDEGALLDTGATSLGGGLVQADKINGGYVETATFNLDGTFTSSGFASFGQYYLGGFVVNPVQLTNTYGIVATFTTAGNFAPTLCGPFPCTIFSGVTAAIEIYLDPQLDSFTAVDGNDVLLASTSSLIGLNGTLIPAFGGGFFDITFTNFLLTAAGEQYFVQPDPFYIQTVVDGDFDSFTPAGTQTIRGDISAVFVPEPEILALMGMGLLGFGVSRRKKLA